MNNQTTKQIEGRMGDCLHFRAEGLYKVQCHAQHPDQNRPALIPNKDCTRSCGKYAPLEPSEGGTQ